MTGFIRKTFGGSRSTAAPTPVAKTPETVEKEKTMPTADKKALAKAQQRRAAKRRGGRVSTMLDEDEYKRKTLGGS